MKTLKMLKSCDPSTRQGLPLTVTPLYRHTSCDAVNDDETYNVASIILNEALELLDFLSDGIPDVLLSLWLHVDIRGLDVYPENE